MPAPALAVPAGNLEALRTEHLTALKKARWVRYQGLYGQKDAELGRQLRMADAVLCAADPVYWMNQWGFVRDEHADNPDLRDVPFVLWPAQVDLVRWLEERLEAGQVAVVPKSRKIGVTWLFLHWCYHRWRFKGASSILASRVEELVDKRGSMRSLFEKLRYIHKWQPRHLKEPKVQDTYLLFKNLRTGAEFTGTSTNADLSRGNRSEILGIDEFAAVPARLADRAISATESVARCRVFIYNPDSPLHPSERLRQQLSAEQVFVMDWTADPYRDEAWRRSVELPKGALTPEQAQQEYDCIAGAVSGHKIFSFRDEVVGYRDDAGETSAEWARIKDLARAAFFCPGGWDFGSGASLLCNVVGLVQWDAGADGDPRDFHLWIDWARAWRQQAWTTAAGDVREALVQYGGPKLHYADPSGAAKESDQGSWIGNLQAGRVPVWPLPWTINTTENRDWAIRHVQYLLDEGRIHVNVSREGGRMVLAAMRAWERDVPDWVRDLDVVSRAHVAPKKDGNSHACEAVLYLVSGVLLALKQRIADKEARDQSPQQMAAQLSALSGAGSRGALAGIFAELYGRGQ